MWTTVAGLAASAAVIHLGRATYRDSLAFIVDPLLAAALIVQGTAYSSVGLGRILNWGWVRYLGMISYSIYLYHPFAMSLGEKLFRKLPGLRSVSALGAVVCVVAVASASYLLLEQPIQKLRARFSLQPNAPESSRASGALLTPIPEGTTAL